jgi:hypothetical protein
MFLSINGTNGISRDNSKKIRDRDTLKKRRDGTNGIRDTKKFVPQTSKAGSKVNSIYGPGPDKKQKVGPAAP